MVQFFLPHSVETKKLVNRCNLKDTRRRASRRPGLELRGW